MKVEEQNSYPDLTGLLGITVLHSWLLLFPRPLVLCSPISVSSPPPSSCWEWRLLFSCHLHSQSIRTPQLSRLAELGGRWRRERVLWGLSPPHRSHSAPDCFLLCGAQPAGQGGSGNPAASLLGTRVGEWGQQGWAEGWEPGSLCRILACWRALGAPPTPLAHKPH